MITLNYRISMTLMLAVLTGPSCSETFTPNDPETYNRIIWRKKHMELFVATDIVVRNNYVYYTLYDDEWGHQRCALYSSSVKDGRLKWVHRSSDYAELSSAAVGDEKIFINGYGDLISLDISSGKELWRQHCGQVIYGVQTPVLLDGSVYVVAEELRAGDLFQSYEAKSGTRLWDIKTEPFEYGLSVGEGSVYFVTNYGALTNIDIQSRSEKWRHQYDAMDGGFITAPTAAEGVVCVGGANYGSEGNQLYSIDIHNGNILWKYETPGAIRNAAEISDGVVYFGSDDGMFYALQVHTGSLIWKYKMQGAVSTRAVIDEGVAYLGCKDRYVYAIDIDAGKLLWRILTEAEVTSTPTVDEGVLYVGSGSYLYAIRAH